MGLRPTLSWELLGFVTGAVLATCACVLGAESAGSTTVVDSAGLEVVTARGEVSNADIGEAFQDLLGRGVLKRGSRVLVLYESTYDADAAQTREAAAIMAGFGGELGRVAVVVPTDLKFGVGRMIEAYGEHLGAKLRVFRSRDAAEGWLRGEAD